MIIILLIFLYISNSELENINLVITTHYDDLSNNPALPYSRYSLLWRTLRTKVHLVHTNRQPQRLRSTALLIRYDPRLPLLQRIIICGCLLRIQLVTNPQHYLLRMGRQSQHHLVLHPHGQSQFHLRNRQWKHFQEVNSGSNRCVHKIMGYRWLIQRCWKGIPLSWPQSIFSFLLTRNKSVHRRSLRPWKNDKVTWLRITRTY